MGEDEFDERLPGETETLARNLEAMSVKELEKYIVDLKDEIARVQEAIGARRKLRSGADAVFKNI
jgi:uncharacterized small protein (DUF1192 family)